MFLNNSSVKLFEHSIILTEEALFLLKRWIVSIKLLPPFLKTALKVLIACVFCMILKQNSNRV